MRGDVFVDVVVKETYSKDGASHQRTPIAIAAPSTILDQQIALEIARDLKVPVIARGSGTSLRGQCLGEALVIDTRHALKRVLAINSAAMTVTVEPGISLGALNVALATENLWFPAALPRFIDVTIGGMVGNNAIGMSALRYGDTAQSIHTMDLILSDGTPATFGPFGDGGEMVLSNARLNRLIPQLFQITGAALTGPASKRGGQQWIGGYNLDVFKAGHLQSIASPGAHGLVNFAQLLAGSEGTLATIESVTLKLHHRPRHRLAALLNFAGIAQLISQLPAILSLDPSAVVLVHAPAKGPVSISVDFHGDEERVLQQSLRDLAALAQDQGLTPPIEAPAGWMDQAAHGRDLCFQDTLVPTPMLMDFIGAIDQIFGRFGLRNVWRGHAVSGAFYLRPVLAPEEVSATRLQDIQAAVGEATTRFRDAGYSRQIASQIKTAFDPENLLNPGRIAAPTR